jgi:hypothetical protein
MFNSNFSLLVHQHYHLGLLALVPIIVSIHCHANQRSKASTARLGIYVYSLGYSRWRFHR